MTKKALNNEEVQFGELCSTSDFQPKKNVSILLVSIGTAHITILLLVIFFTEPIQK